MGSLHKLSSESICKIISSLEELNIPDSLHAFCFMKHMLEWQRKEPEVEFDVYAPDGDFKDLTFVLTFTIAGGFYCTYYSTSDEGCIRMKKALEKWTLISGDAYCVLTSIPDRVHNIVGLEWKDKVAIKPPHIQACHNYIIGQEEASSLIVQCPDDVYIRDLKLEDADVINANWPHRNHITLKLIRGTISSSTCLGLCSKENGELLSWAVEFYYGGVGVVQTVDHAKRKGYAKAVVAALVKRMGKESMPIHLVIIDDNFGSIALFTKMGFKKLNKCFWFHYNAFS